MDSPLPPLGFFSLYQGDPFEGLIFSAFLIFLLRFCLSTSSYPHFPPTSSTSPSPIPPFPSAVFLLLPYCSPQHIYLSSHTRYHTLTTQLVLLLPIKFSLIASATSDTPGIPLMSLSQYHMSSCVYHVSIFSLMTERDHVFKSLLICVC